MAGSNKAWNKSVDVLVVGSGNGALTAALCCSEMSADKSGTTATPDDILVIEKSGLVGGTSATSGGGVWIPCNRYAKAAGAKDSLAEAKEYLANTIPNIVPKAMVDCYLENGPKMIDFLHERSDVRYISLEQYPDYYSNVGGAKVGHRSMEPEPFDISLLGKDHKRLRPTHHMMRMFGRIYFTQVEAHKLIAQLPGWFSLTLKLLLSYVADISWRFRDKNSRRICTGAAGIGRLWLSLKKRGVPIELNTKMVRLIEANGRVVGVLAKQNGKDYRIQAKKAVVLAAGGFERNQAMREQYLPDPTNQAWSGGVESNTGDAINAGLSLGAATSQMNGAWWCTTVSVPDEPAPRLSIMEKSYPGSCVVNSEGKRIANESQNYMAYQLAFFQKDTDANPCVPAYQIFDARFRRDYIVGPLMSAALKPDWTIPKQWFDSKLVGKADSVEALAKQVGISATGLKQTISDMNRYAETGIDVEFQRGDAAYDRYYGDPRFEPNPCLGKINEAPFYAMRIEPGDFGTQGGLVTNTDAQVLNESGVAIQGLYAVGNCSAAVLPTYPGPGSTLGPAMTFAYQSAKHIYQWEES